MPTQDAKLRDIQRRLERDVAAKIDEFGVPMDTDAVYDITVELHPIVVKYRQEAYRAYVEQMGRDMAQLGLEVAPARIQGYGPHATYDALARAAGFGEKQSNIILELVDDETKELIKKSVPAFAFPNHPRVIEQMSARLTRTLMRHTLNAGRKAVADTAHLGRVRNATTKRPIGRRIGYARVLTGRESCAFCAMLASRGPVYSEDTATRRADGRRYHDGCDCRAVLVIEGQPWEGEQEFHRLQAAWREATWEDGRSVDNQWNRWQKAVHSGKVKLRATSETQRQGKLILNGVKPAAHETKTYNFLVSQGHVVELIPRSNTSKTADCMIDGIKVEIKAPQGSGKETIYQLVRNGSKQSATLIIDLHRSSIPVDEAILQVDRAMARYTRVKQVTIITRDRKVVKKTRG
ncbi:hypothetical protein [Corynebacterium amycolatum]|uniref:VG15 protein n=1 Tax=Corynebacterium amycolatum TaxID=43765 RepID=UPI0025504CF4|nr:hypothetical protein [Corynebacterium amycolatum]MDK8726756.1 hypothetical protein [Corynebacterium amycolatum]